jgi:hypothetical protein
MNGDIPMLKTLKWKLNFRLARKTFKLLSGPIKSLCRDAKNSRSITRIFQRPLVILLLILMITLFLTGCAVKAPKTEPIHPGLARIPLPESPKDIQIEGFNTLKDKGVWTAPAGGGVCFTAKAFDMLKYRDDLRDYYSRALKRSIDDHNKRIEDWFKAQGLIK